MAKLIQMCFKKLNLREFNTELKYCHHVDTLELGLGPQTR